MTTTTTQPPDPSASPTTTPAPATASPTFDMAAYSPGDPWISKEFLTRALSGPRIVNPAANVGDTTVPSYFETRSLTSIGARYVEVVAISDAVFEVHLQWSFDDGQTWSTRKVYVGTSVSDTITHDTICMLRLKVMTATSPVSLRLHQDL